MAIGITGAHVSGGLMGLLNFLGFDQTWIYRLLLQGVVPATLFCLWAARRTAAPTLAETLDADGRPPVLHLRAFESESEIVVELGPLELGRYSSMGLQRAGIALEEYLGPAHGKKLGPFVALGSPVNNLSPESWDTFARTLTAAGYRPLARDPGFGAVLAFDADTAHMQRLAIDARTPEDFVRPIQVHLWARYGGASRRAKRA